MDGPLLSIAIPTFNRSALLDTCLSQICKQLKAGQREVEVVVSNNCSPDDTEQIVKKYIANGCPIRYVRNSENIGGDRNVHQCFTLASGKYVIVCGDDDVFLDGSIEKLLSILRNGEYGVVNLGAYSYKKDPFKEKPKRKAIFKYIIYRDAGRFIGKVNCMLTFLSTNVVNRSLASSGIEESGFHGTGIAQTVWTFTAALNAKQNMVVDELMVAAMQGNNPNMILADVFVVNQQKIFDRFISTGEDPRYFRIYNSKLLENFFPFFIYYGRSNRKAGMVVREDYLKVFRTYYSGFVNFWIFTAPVIVLPLPLAKLWLTAGTIYSRGRKVLNKTWIIVSNVAKGNWSATLTVGK